MQAKDFLSYLLATILAVGVIATPLSVSGSTNDVNTVFENGGNPGLTGKAPDPRPSEPVITPKAGDVPTTSTGVGARDLGTLEKRTIGCANMTIDANFGGETIRVCDLPNGYCMNLGPFWRWGVSSFSPEEYTFCKIFTDPDCLGVRSVMFGSPGYGNLGIWDNNMGSFECWY